MNHDFSDLAATMNVIAGSAVSWEMAVRLGQSLEITDALWDLVPVAVAAGEQVDERSATQAADQSTAARGLDSDSRARVRTLGDAYIAAMDTAIAGQHPDENALASLTAADVMADPFGTGRDLRAGGLGRAGAVVGGPERHHPPRKRGRRTP